MPAFLSIVGDSAILQKLPWLSHKILDNSLYAYMLTSVSFVVLFAALILSRRFMIGQMKLMVRHGGHGLLAFFHDLLVKLNPFVLGLVAFYLAFQRLNMPDTLSRGIYYVTLAFVTAQAARILGDMLSYGVMRFGLRTRGDDAAIRNTNNNITALLRFAVWTAAVLFVLDNMGFNVSTFIAGLGIGGAALALASQAILGDTFSSFAISLDRPFEVGDFIVVDALNGTVEHIGLKTTRVRSSTGELLIFANSDLTRSRIKNFQQMQQRQAKFRVAITYQTPVEKVRLVPEILKAAVTAQPYVKLDRAHFQSFGDYALLYEVVYFVNKPDYNLYMDIQQSINLQILEALAREGISLAYPTQTVFVEKTAGEA